MRYDVSEYDIIIKLSEKTAFIHAMLKNKTPIHRLPNLSHIKYNMKCWRMLPARVSNVNVCRSSPIYGTLIVL